MVPEGTNNDFSFPRSFAHLSSKTVYKKENELKFIKLGCSFLSVFEVCSVYILFL